MSSRFPEEPSLVVPASIFALPLVFGFLFVLQTDSCTADKLDAHRTLAGLGMTDVEWGEAESSKCGYGELLSLGFTATNAHGDRVSGVVCCQALTDSCTVHF